MEYVTMLRIGNNPSVPLEEVPDGRRKVQEAVDRAMQWIGFVRTDQKKQEEKTA